MQSERKIGHWTASGGQATIGQMLRRESPIEPHELRGRALLRYLVRHVAIAGAVALAALAVLCCAIYAVL